LEKKHLWQSKKSGRGMKKKVNFVGGKTETVKKRSRGHRGRHRGKSVPDSKRETVIAHTKRRKLALLCEGKGRTQNKLLAQGSWGGRDIRTQTEKEGGAIPLLLVKKQTALVNKKGESRRGISAVMWRKEKMEPNGQDHPKTTTQKGGGV